MDRLEDMMKDLFKMEIIDEILFKPVRISPNKTIYFAFKESQKIFQNRLTSASLEPVCFILKIDGEYHYCPLNDNEFDESIVREFVAKFN